jgi:uncharacterized repeat protein (TIGR03803 family)
MKRFHISILVGVLGVVSAVAIFAQPPFVTLYSFATTTPVGVSGGNGVIYGATAGSTCQAGTVFQLAPPSSGGPGDPWVEMVLYTFTGTPGDACNAAYAPIVGADGALYGLTNEGGAYNFGTVYRLQPPAGPGGAWTETVLYSISGLPSSDLVRGPNGSFYFLTGTYAGALVQLLPPSAPGGAWTSTVLYMFPGGVQGPPISLVASGGLLYGTLAYIDIRQDGGSIFQLSPPAVAGGAWTEKIVYNLKPGEGATPNSLTPGPGGVLYGTAWGNNAFGAGPGTAFQLTPPATPGGNWTFALLKNFGYDHPTSPLVLWNGDLYGTLFTSDGGAVFRLQPPSTPGGAWTTNYLHHFTNYEGPIWSLMGPHGILYGATRNIFGWPPGRVYAISTK